MSDKSRKFWVRFTAIVMAVLMVGGTAYATISMLFS